jgi:hydrogenase maturation protease
MRTLVAGVGNIFMGDDGFGVEVAQRLRQEPLDGVDVADFGIRAIHLAYELTSGAYGAAVLVDAVRRGGQPGTVYVIDAAVGVCPTDAGAVDAHTLTPDGVLGLLAQLGARPERLVIVGCEPATVEESVGLSRPVAAAVERAIAITRDLVHQLVDAPTCA